MTETIKKTVEDIAKDISEQVAKNCGTSPQLIYAPVLWGLKDAIENGYLSTDIIRSSFISGLREASRQFKEFGYVKE